MHQESLTLASQRLLFPPYDSQTKSKLGSELCKLANAVFVALLMADLHFAVKGTGISSVRPLTTQPLPLMPTSGRKPIPGTAGLT